MENKPKLLASEINYSPDSIVSKVLLKSPKGNVTLFSFDGGQELSEHTAPFDAMINVIEGNAVIFIDKEQHSLDAGEFILLPANIPHAVQAKERFKMVLSMIRE